MATPQNELPAASLEKFTGLFKSVGRFSIPPGAMQVAQNLVIPGGSLLTLRRGFEAGVDGGTDCAALSFYGDLVAYFTTAGALASTLSVVNADTGLGWSVSRAVSDCNLLPASLLAVGLQVPAVTAGYGFFTSNGNLYLTGLNFGLGVLALPATPTQSEGWAPAGMDTPVISSVSSSGAGTLLPGPGVTAGNITYTYGAQVAYRTTYRYTDANGNIHRSAPSEKVMLQNTTAASTVNVSVTFGITPMVRPGTVIEVWRTFTVPAPQDGGDVTGDECFKVYEYPLANNTNLGVNSATGYYQVTGAADSFGVLTGDNTPDTPYLVEPLYTNPTTGAVNGLGIGNANAMPPAAVDTFQFKGYTYYANTQEVQSVQVQITGTGAGGIVDGDTFTVDGVAYQWKDSGSAAAGYYKVQLWRTGGSLDAGSIVLNLFQSARAAADAINIKSGLYYSGFSYSGIAPNNSLNQKLRAVGVTVNGLPGYINITRLLPDGQAFSVVAGTGAGRGWAGSLAVANTSDPNRQPNALMQSQYNDPESVPPAFTETVGHADSSILKGVPLRDTCLLYKSGLDGLWKFVDDGNGNLTISCLDPTVHLIAPKTATFLDNASYALCDKGVLKVTDGGAPENISDEKLRLELADLIAHVGLDTLATVAFGVAYEAEKLYILNLPEGPNATNCTIQYVYNITTDSWTTWSIPDTQSGGVSPFNGKLFIGRDTSVSRGSALWRERKDNTDDDYQDPALSFTWPGTATATTLTLSGDQRALPYYGFAQGDQVSYVTGGHSYTAFVNSVSYSGSTNQTTVTFSASLPMVSAETYTLRKAIQSNFTLLPLTDGDPLYDKQWQDVYLYFRYCVNDRILLSFGSNRQQVPTTYPLPGPTDTYWYDDGLGWGDYPWGGTAQDVVLKLGMDQAAARGVELTLTVDMSRARCGWQLSAIRVPYLPTTRKAVR